MPLHPQVKALLDLIYRIDAPPFHTLSVSQARHAARKLMFGLRPRGPKVALVRDVVITGECTPHDIAARYYRPRGHAGDVLPLLVYFHGGGWTVGDIESIPHPIRPARVPPMSRSGRATGSIATRSAISRTTTSRRRLTIPTGVHRLCSPPTSPDCRQRRSSVLSSILCSMIASPWSSASCARGYNCTYP